MAWTAWSPAMAAGADETDPKQKKRLVELIEAGPQVVSLETACWNSVCIRVLIWREFGVLYNRHYVCTLLHNLGFSFQKARFVSDHLDAAKRLAWLEQKWPTIVRAAKRRQGLILFEDEASFAQWGSLSYTWARRGRQPEVPTSGKRKGYKVFGAIEYFSGCLFYQGIEGRFHSDSYQAFLQMIMAQTTQHLFLITMALVITQAHRPKRFWRLIVTASRRSPSHRIRRITIRLNTCGRRRNSGQRTTSTSRSLPR